MKKIFWMVGVLVVGGCRSVTAAPADTDIESLRDLLVPVQSLSGHFAQRISDADGTEVQASEGEFTLQKPGQLRWQTEAPYSQLLVANATRLWLYDPDLEQVTIKTVDQSIRNTPVAILSGEYEQLKTEYRIVRTQAGGQGDAYEFYPLDGHAVFEHLTLQFGAGLPRIMRLYDNLGQTTEITFSALNLNPAVNADLFDFVPPPGTDVLIDD